MFDFVMTFFCINQNLLTTKNEEPGCLEVYRGIRQQTGPLQKEGKTYLPRTTRKQD